MKGGAKLAWGNALNELCARWDLSLSNYGYGTVFGNFRAVQEFFSFFFCTFCLIYGGLDRNFRVVC